MSVLYGTDQFPPPTPSPLIWPKSPPSPINTLINIVINADKNDSLSPQKDVADKYFSPPIKLLHALNP